MTKFRGILSAFLITTTAFGIIACVSRSDASAKERPRVQQQSAEPTQFRLPCTFGSGMSTAIARRSGKPVPVQTSCQVSPNGGTTVIARPFGSENDKYACVGECRVVRMCLAQYCRVQSLRPRRRGDRSGLIAAARGPFGFGFRK